MTRPSRLFEPLDLGPLELPNRIVMTAHSTSLPDERELAYLARRAAGGAGLIGLAGSLGVIQYAVGPGERGTVGEWDRNPPSPATPAGIAYYHDLAIPRLRARADVIRAGGARSFAQIAHAGASVHWPSITPALAPSTVPDTYDGRVPHELTDEQIEELVGTFAHGVRRIAEAGVDAAELHGAHGYLIMQFLSPHTNRRTDRWGGSVENRTRFVRSALDAARELTAPDFPIGIRLGYDHSPDGRGITVPDLVAIARTVAPQVAWVNVSGGSYTGLDDGFTGGYVSPWHRPPAYNAAASAAVREAVDVPVVLTGRITDVAMADALLADGSGDLIGMVRALIADPDLPRKARTGAPEAVLMCLGLSECHHVGRDRTAMTCAVNASAGREAELEITRAPEPRTVVVVGAGPAGMEAARVAALRGHRVYLGDEHRHLGGTPRLLAADPRRRNLLDHAVHFESELPRLGVELLLGHRVTAADIAEFEADVVIVATGSRSRTLASADPAGPLPLTDKDVIAGAVVPAHHAVVVAGTDHGIAGPSVAELLADRGHDVTLLSELPDFAPGVEDTTRLALLQRLKQKRVGIASTSRLLRHDGSDCVVLDTFTRAERTLEDVALVHADGRVADDRLHHDLSALGVPSVLVGDALAPRRIMHATIEGARAALAV